MREIKFRGVHPSSGQVMDVCCIDWMHDEVYFEQGADVSYPIDQCSLMQFTGLTDVNGVEIYEGDIVESNEMLPSEVCFDEANCCFSFGDWPISDYMMVSATLSLKVIGDIHQNPELLK